MNEIHMTPRTLRTIFAVLIAASVVPTHAASFDCTKAGVKVEKFICEHEAISKLDDELAATYRVLLEKLDPATKQRVSAEQRHWLTHTRAPCRNETCFKLAYWARQAELATYFEPKSPLYARESDKAEAIQKVLATAKLFKAWKGARPQCDQLFADLKQMKGIRFVAPVAQAMSFEDPALDPWQKNCRGKPPLHFSWACEPGQIGLDPGDIMNAMEGICQAGFGQPPFKVFELPPLKAQDKPHYLLYSDASYWPINNELWHPNLGGGRFLEFSIETCASPANNGIAVPLQGNVKDGPNYNSIIEYRKRYFVLVLEYQYDSYWLNVEATDRNENCRWSPVVHNWGTDHVFGASPIRNGEK